MVRLRGSESPSLRRNLEPSRPSPSKLLRWPASSSDLLRCEPLQGLAIVDGHDLDELARTSPASRRGSSCACRLPVQWRCRLMRSVEDVAGPPAARAAPGRPCPGCRGCRTTGARRARRRCRRSCRRRSCGRCGPRTTTVPPVMYSQPWSPTPSTTATAPLLRTANRSPARPLMNTSPLVAP